MENIWPYGKQILVYFWPGSFGFSKNITISVFFGHFLKCSSTVLLLSINCIAEWYNFGIMCVLQVTCVHPFFVWQCHDLLWRKLLPSIKFEPSKIRVNNILVRHRTSQSHSQEMTTFKQWTTLKAASPSSLAKLTNFYFFLIINNTILLLNLLTAKSYHWNKSTNAVNW